MDPQSTVTVVRGLTKWCNCVVGDWMITTFSLAHTTVCPLAEMAAGNMAGYTLCSVAWDELVGGGREGAST